MGDTQGDDDGCASPAQLWLGSAQSAACGGRAPAWPSDGGGVASNEPVQPPVRKLSAPPGQWTRLEDKGTDAVGQWTPLETCDKNTRQTNNNTSRLTVTVNMP